MTRQTQSERAAAMTAELYAGDPAEQRVNVSALKTCLCHPNGAYLMVSTQLWRDPGYAIQHGPYGAGVWAKVWPVDRKAVQEHFGDLPKWPGEYVDLQEKS